MDIKEQILVALGLDKSSDVKLAWQAKSEDGTIFVSTAEELAEGVDVSVLTEDGTTILLPIGTYTTEEGVTFRVDEEGIVAEVLETESEEEAEEGAPVEEDLAEEVSEDLAEEADVEDWAGMEKRIQNLEDAVASLKSELASDDEEEKECPNGHDEEGNCIEEEEMSTPSVNPKSIKTTEVVEFSIEDLKAENDLLKAELNAKPAAAPLDTNKFSSERAEPTKQDFRRMTKQEKFLYNLHK